MCVGCVVIGVCDVGGGVCQLVRRSACVWLSFYEACSKLLAPFSRGVVFGGAVLGLCCVVVVACVFGVCGDLSV